MSTTYIKKTKRNKVDICNICLELKEMTWDHVPPQGCSNHQKVEISSFFKKLSGERVQDKPILSQNGLKYRTICGDCNSLLGGKYDDELNNLVKTVLSFVESKLVLPQLITLIVKPLPIIKSVTGHILAAKKELDQVTYDKVFRAFVLDENAPVPEDLHLFYWVYPFDNTVVMRDFYMSATRDGNFGNAVA